MSLWSFSTILQSSRLMRRPRRVMLAEPAAEITGLARICWRVVEIEHTVDAGLSRD